MADELFVLEMNHQAVSVRHGEHHATSVRRPHKRLIGDLLLLSEKVFVHVHEDTDMATERERCFFSFKGIMSNNSSLTNFTCKLL